MFVRVHLLREVGEESPCMKIYDLLRLNNSDYVASPVWHENKTATPAKQKWLLD